MSKKKKARANDSHVPQVNNESPATKSAGDANAQYKLKPGVIRLAAIAVVIVLLLLLFAFVFANRSNNQGQIAADNQNSSDNGSASQNNGSTTPTPLPSTTASGNTNGTDPNSQGDINGTGINTDGTSNVAESAQIKSEADSAQIDKTGKWNATDYSNGEITKGNYQVSRGDTLWEIAEATYGSGFQWTKILNANKSSIGRLKNGQQALIRPGQVLVIP
jgi:nucleoid-associated protein YgaU